MKTQTPLSESETSKILTPFAFKIDQSLFGIALAVPSKRALAILLDFIFVAFLSQTSGEVLALLVALTLYRLGQVKRINDQGKVMGKRRRGLLRITGVFIFVLVFVQLVSGLLSQSDDENILQKETKQVQLSQQGKQQTAPILFTERKPAPTAAIEQVAAQSAESVPPMVKWVKEQIDDLGLGFGWAAFYFTMFTALWHGQTPGKKVLGIKVLQLDGTPLSIWDSFGRYGGYVAGLATGLLGFAQVFWDPNRQTIHDKISATIVIDIAKAKQHLAKIDDN
jgi:hypothetical protein